MRNTGTELALCKRGAGFNSWHVCTRTRELPPLTMQTSKGIFKSYEVFQPEAGLKIDQVSNISGTVLSVHGITGSSRNKGRMEQCLVEGAHLTLDFHQKSEATENSHTYGIAQGHIFRNLPRETPKHQSREPSHSTSRTDHARPRLTSRQNMSTSERWEVMMGTSDSSSSSRASTASQAFACHTEKSWGYSALWSVHRWETPAPPQSSPHLQGSEPARP